MIEPQISHIEPLTVVGLEASFIHKRQHDPNRVVGSTVFGVIYGCPVEERSHPDELQYIAGVPVHSTSEIPDGWPAHNGHVEIVSIRLDAGADIEADEINCYGGKPLHWASEHEPEAVKLLLDRGQT